MGRLAELLGTATTVVRTAHEQDVRYPAAALAYYVFVSFIPLLSLVFAVVGERFAYQIYTVTPQFLTLEAQQLVFDAMTAATGRIGTVLLAVAVLVWSGTNIAVGFQTTVQRVEGGPEGSLADQLRNAVVVLGSFALAIVSIVVTSTLGALLPSAPLSGLVAVVGLFVALAISFLPLYYVPSRLATSPPAALPGALTAAFGWTILHTAVQFYATHAAQYAIYGVLSGIIIILTSLYLAAVVLLVGIVVNATFADEADTRR